VVKHSDACNRIRLAVSEMGGLSLPYTTGMFEAAGRPVKVGREGASDIIACIDGRFVAIEVKVGHDTWRLDQRMFRSAVERAGGVYVLARFTPDVDGVETLRAALNPKVLDACPYCNGEGWREAEGKRFPCCGCNS
jgi:hypothetical protein